MSALFSSAVYREMARKGRSARFARLHNIARLEMNRETRATVGDAFNSAFGVLKSVGLRDEYVYRAALTQKILLGTHSLNTACVLSEFRTGTCKADVVILNGTATAYEIKSERDSITRLANQMDNYKKVFAKAYVIVGDSHLSGVFDTVSREIGIMRLSRRNQISTEREAEDRPDRICPVTVFESLRSAEAQAVLLEMGISVPEVPNTRLHGVMRHSFERLKPAELHFAMVKILKRTRNLAPLSALVDQLPLSLHAAALSIQIRRCEHSRLVKAVNTPLDAAISWN
ncbi:MAG: sce7726 family protein [Rhizobiales bacterium]|nr:sce7726 family protein [Hyphomicrobiales bacterium]